MDTAWPSVAAGSTDALVDTGDTETLSDHDAVSDVGDSGGVAAPSEEERFMLGLTQFVIARGVRLGLKGRVLDLMSYTTGDGTADDDIVSIAVRFSPDRFIDPDPGGLIQVAPSQTSVDTRECTQSASIPAKVIRRVRVDHRLTSDRDEMERCTAESSSLLVSAGYDAAAYAEWVASDPLHR